MVMSRIFTGIVLLSIVASIFTGNGSALAAAVGQGAQSGITLVISMAGTVCLWTGVGKLMERIGFTEHLSRFLMPLLSRIFPSAKKDKVLAGHLSANICANILGLGNAATPMGILAARDMAAKALPGTASDELCRLIVMNTASIQLIPATVAAVRASAGCATPFDILPAVWITSVLSTGCGLTCAWFLGKLWRKK